VVHVEWLKDYPPHVLGGSSTQTRQDHLEREVWRVLSSVAAITAKLESASSKSEVMKSSRVLYNWLPVQVRQFAPLPSWTRPTFAPNQYVAKDVAIWRQNSLSNAGDNPATAVPSSYDDEEANPYWYAREKLVKLIRQEAFSFAAATTVEAGPEEISALLHTCDTSTRLSWCWMQYNLTWQNLKHKIHCWRPWERCIELHTLHSIQISGLDRDISGPAFNMQKKTTIDPRLGICMTSRNSCDRHSWRSTYLFGIGFKDL